MNKTLRELRYLGLFGGIGLLVVLAGCEGLFEMGQRGGADVSDVSDVSGGVDVSGEVDAVGDVEGVGEDLGLGEDVRVEVDVVEVDVVEVGDVEGVGEDLGLGEDVAEVEPVEGECANVYVVEILGLVNAARAENGSGALACDPLLVRAARLHAEDMCAQNYFSHTSLDGRNFGQRFREQGVSYRAGGENIAKGQQSSQSVMTSWMNSTGHRKNILSANFERLGVGHAQCASGRYWVQTFAG